MEGQSVTVNPRGPGKDTTAEVKTNKQNKRGRRKHQQTH